MIEIKNKRMLLFPEDRIIGAAGDVNTAQRQFVLDKIQDGFDLSSFVAWIKLEPSSGEEAYNQLIKKEIVDNRIVLTWLLSGANLKHEGELSAQIVFASPDYFKEEDLESLSGEELVVPATIAGVSAPVWQSYKETFVIDSSIDDTVAYSDVTKNVLLSAVAQAVENFEKTEELYEECESTRTAVSMMYGSVCENMEYAETLRSSTEAAALSARDSKEAAELSSKEVSENVAIVKKYHQYASDSAEISQVLADECFSLHNQIWDIYENIKTELEQSRLKENYQLIFSKTLTEEDTGCVAFEIDSDINGAALNLRELCIFMYIPTMPDAQSVYLRLEAKCGDSNVFSKIAQFAGIGRSSDSYLRIEAKNKGRWTTKYSKATSWFQNAESVSVGGTLCSNSRTSDGENAKAIRIVQNSELNTDFPVGTLVEIWGINSPNIEEGANE